MARWWREFRNPRLKCERIGHDMKPVTLEGYCQPELVDGARGLIGMLNGAVAFGVELKTSVCSRCNHEDESARSFEQCRPIQSLSMSSDRWAQMNRTGFSLRRVNG